MAGPIPHPYAVHPGVAHLQAILGNLAKNTGHDLDVWVARVEDASGRPIDTGGFAKKDRLTHRIEIRNVEDIDEALARWLATACARDAKG